MTSLAKRSLFIFFFSLLLFLVFLPSEFIAFQTRFGLFAQEMFRHGITFFPQTYMGSYPDYPISSTVMIYLVSLLFGHVSPLTAILPTAIISSLTLVLIYRIGALENEQLGIYAVLFALFTQYFIEESRTISLDQYIAFFTALGFYLVYSADVYQKFKRLLFLPLVLLLGFAFRGPIGLVIPAGVLCGYYLYRKEYTHFLKFGFMAAFVFLAQLIGRAEKLSSNTCYQCNSPTE
jgi:4-amino-4-deoxy-L-arabinose transferase-like glycosyltransferase